MIERDRKGESKPGGVLDSLDKTAKTCDVTSRTVREPISGLRAMGLVETRQGEGTFITSFDGSSFSLPVSTDLIMQKEDIKELNNVRRLIEIVTDFLVA